MAGVLALALLGGGAGSASAAGLLAFVGVGVVILAFDRRNLFTMRNFFLVYTVALFVFGVPLFHLSPALYGDMILYLFAFLGAYAVGSVRRSGRQRPTVEARTSARRIAVMEEVMVLLACLQMILLAFQISQYGIAVFYSGQSLVDQLSTYGSPSVQGALVQAVTFMVKYSAIAIVVLYAQSCLRAGFKVRYRYPLLLLVVVPIVSLARSDALHGAGLLVVLNAADHRISARLARKETEGGTAPSGPPRRRVLALGAIAVVALLAGLVIGGLRQNKLAPEDTSRSAIERSLPLLESEFTPIRAYSEIKENAAILGRQHGATIVPPVLLKVVPRGLYPGKPLNSGAYYMSVVRPSEFEAGFAVPPTLFGDAQLNFGLSGALLACLLVGIISARLDIAYVEPRLSRLPWFLIVFANYYSLLRSPLSETLASILLMSIAFLVFRRLLQGRVVPATTNATPGPALPQRSSA